MNRIYNYTIIGSGILGSTSGLTYGVQTSINNFSKKKLTATEVFGEYLCASSIIASSGLTGFCSGLVVGFLSPAIVPIAGYYLYKAHKEK